MTLQELGLKYGTDKADAHGYLPIYEEVLADYRYKTFNLMEIGVYRGASCQMWLDYFPRANIIGVDADIGQCKVRHERLTLFQCHADNPALARLVQGNETLDVIIDDASHVPWHQHIAAHYLWPLMRKGGYYFVEDLIDESQIDSWRVFPGFQVWTPHKNGKEDDILVMWRNL